MRVKLSELNKIHIIRHQKQSTNFEWHISLDSHFSAA